RREDEAVSVERRRVAEQRVRAGERLAPTGDGHPVVVVEVDAPVPRGSGELALRDAHLPQHALARLGVAQDERHLRDVALARAGVADAAALGARQATQVGLERRALATRD